MAIAAGVSGYLSFGGGQEIFGNDFTALGFTLVVQTVVCVALWYFALARGIQRPLLAVVWAIAVTFSIMTAYVSADRVNDVNDVELAKLEFTEFIRLARGKIAAEEAAADAKDAEVEVEANDGGCGPKCRKLKDEAATTAQRGELLGTDDTGHRSRERRLFRAAGYRSSGVVRNLPRVAGKPRLAGGWYHRANLHSQLNTDAV